VTATPARALVVAPSWVGDAVMATPALCALRNAWPKARIALVCRPGIDQILDGLESGGRAVFDEVLVESMSGALGPLRAARRLRRLRAEVAVLLPNSFRTGLCAALARVPIRVGYARDGRGLLLTRPVPRPSARPRSTLEDYCDLVEKGCSVPVDHRAPRLGLRDEDRAAAAALRAEVDGPYALFVPGGNNPAKRWPPERFAELAGWCSSRGLRVVVSGSPGERDVLDAIVALAPPSARIVHLGERRTTLAALKGIVEGAALVVANDTGPRHIAAAFRVPTVALFGPTDHRFTILPGVPERLLVAEPFLPEELVADDRPEVCRIDRIAVGDVIAAAEALLAQPRETAQPASVRRP
jgi:heptosyltransferase-2